MEEQELKVFLAQIQQLYIASGKRVLSYVGEEVQGDEALAKVLGRSGKLRAPTLRIADILYVGYSELLYKQLVEELA